MNKDVKAYMASIGKRGGKAKSQAKIDAGKLNAEKAREALALKRQTAKTPPCDSITGTEIVDPGAL